MAKLYPYIFSNDARKQAEFYVHALKGEIINVQTYSDAPNAAAEEIKDKVMHLVFQVAGIHFFMADSVMEPVQSGNQMDLTLEFETEEAARNAFENLSNEGNVLMPFEKMFWGSMFGRLEDSFGVRWQITTKMDN
ncbi:VOC family protein [Chengkuizengella sediminis]|uniref:VOC family protein n=1 Tax=Chengkuizengella sediminis TaxID=1885917 RepID=UPI001389E858|nr:VOC family protein [Chengkuizengella sediminis]NDI34982.1 VOC family protein [Chengkuizengella sediminis]